MLALDKNEGSAVTDLNAYLAARRECVDAALEKFLPRRTEKPEALHEAMRYSVFAGGKRLRPVLCLMAYELCAQTDDYTPAMPSACALEMIHTYSLIHDDLPAMDNDDFRRGKLTCHKAFGDAMAILAGDALLTLAFETVASSDSSVPVAGLVTVLAEAAGHSGMVGGQVLDMEGEGAELDLDAVEDIHRRKTGALIRASIEMGAVAAGATKDECARLADFGRKIGLAFQIKDDILDIEAPKDKLGKTAGKDAAVGKLTYPAVLGLEEARAVMDKTVAEAKQLLEPYGMHAARLQSLADYFVTREY